MSRRSSTRLVARWRVRPHRPTHTRIRCTLDDRIVADVPASMLFFYRRRLDPHALAHALGEVLGDFAPYDARTRMVRGQLFLECGDVGAAFSWAENSAPLDEVLLGLHHHHVRRELVSMVRADHCLDRGDPMVRIRLTHFADEASAIGISVHHSAGDMASFMHLLRAWSAVARGASYAPPVVVEDRPSFFAAAMPDPVGAAPTLRHLTARELAAYEGSMAQIARDQHHFCAFFDDDEMGRLHASVEAAAGRVLSPNDALVGHMFSLIADRDAEIDRRWLAVTVNLRPRLRLPPTLLGNLLGSVNVSLERGIPPGQVAAELRRGLSRVTEDHLDYHANLRFIGEHGDSDLDRYVSTTLDPVRGSLLVTSWRGFDCYGVDFQGAVPYFYTPTGLLPYPWLAGVHEGIDNEGTLFLAMLPRRVFDRMTTPEALGSLHAFRDASRPLPERVSRLPWVR